MKKKTETQPAAAPILWTVTEAWAAMRLDRALTGLAAADEITQSMGLSRARIQQLIKGGAVRVDGVLCADPNEKTKLDQGIEIFVPPAIRAEPVAQDLPITVVFEDDDLLVINKAPGMVVHPAAGNYDGTLVNALLSHCGDGLSGIGGVARPGIVHRLDKDTSGLMVVAKNDLAHQKLTAQFADRSLSRVYQALIWGVPSPIQGEVDAPLGRHPGSRQKMAVALHGGRDALTYYKLLTPFGGVASLVTCKLATGRTHQIRVHMAHIRHPVVGDPLYGTRQRHPLLVKADRGIVADLEAFPRQALHAAEITFIHPRTNKAMRYAAGMPEDMQALIQKLKKHFG